MTVYMGKDRHIHKFKDALQAAVDYEWGKICSYHNYFASIRPAITLCGHGRIACIDCHKAQE